MFGGWRAPLAADPFLAPSLLLAGKRFERSSAYGGANEDEEEDEEDEEEEKKNNEV